MTTQLKQTIIIVLFFITILFSSNTTTAQRFITSPYSRFGLGEIATEGSARNKAMGGVGIALRNKLYLNALNPASYTTLDSTTFVFDAGLTANITQLKNTKQSDNNSQASFEYISFGFAVKKWWGMSAGIRKMSNVGYSLSLKTNDPNKGEYTTTYVGDGGVNKVYLANGFQLTKNLSIGVNANFNWGKITANNAVAFKGGSGFPYHSSEKLTISDINFDFGVQYKINLSKENNNIVLGATFGNKTDLTGEYSKFRYRINPLDTISYTKKDKNSAELPNRFGIGLAFNNEKLTLASDITYQAWGNAASFNFQDQGIAVKQVNSYKIALGAEYTPNKFSGRKFFDRLNYRAGLFYNSSQLEINGTKINELGVSAGLGIPIRGSYINLAIELGKKGTTDNNLIQENYAKLSLSFSLFETWFQKVLYD